MQLLRSWSAFVQGMQSVHCWMQRYLKQDGNTWDRYKSFQLVPFLSSRTLVCFLWSHLTETPCRECCAKGFSALLCTAPIAWRLARDIPLGMFERRDVDGWYLCAHLASSSSVAEALKAGASCFGTWIVASFEVCDLWQHQGYIDLPSFV